MNDDPSAASRLTSMVPLLQVFDMPVSLSFYRDALGFHVHQASGEGDDVDWVMMGNYHRAFMLNAAYEIERRPPAPDPARTGFHKDIALYFSCPDVDVLYAQLVQQGLHPGRPFITGYGWKAMEMIDP